MATNEVKKQYAYNPEGGEHDMWNGPHDSIEAAINDAIDEENIEAGQVLEVCELSMYRGFGVSVDVILDDLRENAMSECGDSAEDWPDVSRADEQELEKRLNEVLYKFFEEKNEMPKFFSCIGDTTQKFPITQEMVDARKNK